jgi:hypothetical protein
MKTAQRIFLILYGLSVVAAIFVPFYRVTDVELAGISCLLLAIYCRLPGGWNE